MPVSLMKIAYRPVAFGNQERLSAKTKPKWHQPSLFDLSDSPSPALTSSPVVTVSAGVPSAPPADLLGGLSASQQAAVKAIEAGENVFVTGPAGSGKSYLIEYLSEHYDAQVTATTGLAALNIQGQILNKWAGIGLADEPPETIIQKLSHARWAGPTVKQIRNTQLLIIDEVSMLSASTMDVLDKVLQGVRGNKRPFGGIQVAMFGDFLQLPPVRKQGTKDSGFCFKSSAWKTLDLRYIQLDKVFRQPDETFSAALQRVRLGQPTAQDLTLLAGRENLTPLEGIRPAHLFATNSKVDLINHLELSKIPNRSEIYWPVDDYGPDLAETLWGMPDGAKAEQARRSAVLDKHCPATNPLVLKENAQVMLLKNLSQTLVNGAMGVVRQMLPNAVLVSFQNGEQAWIERKKWTLKDAQGVVATRSHIPLKLAWGVSIHKSQGQTLDRALVDMGDIFEKGQAYVALSRVKALAGLFLRRFDPRKIEAHPEAIRFYRQLKEQNTSS